MKWDKAILFVKNEFKKFASIFRNIAYAIIAGILIVYLVGRVGRHNIDYSRSIEQKVLGSPLVIKPKTKISLVTQYDYEYGLGGDAGDPKPRRIDEVELSVVESPKPLWLGIGNEDTFSLTNPWLMLKLPYGVEPANIKKWERSWLRGIKINEFHYSFGKSITPGTILSVHPPIEVSFSSPGKYKKECQSICDNFQPKIGNFTVHFNPSEDNN